MAQIFVSDMWVTLCLVYNDSQVSLDVEWRRFLAAQCQATFCVNAVDMLYFLTHTDFDRQMVGLELFYDQISY